MAPSAGPTLHSLTLALGCKNKKQPSGPIELDLEEGNLVSLKDRIFYVFDNTYESKNVLERLKILIYQ